MEKLIVILGPTASGKTSLATTLANEIGSEIISADSRQVYSGMDIGTGKDLSEYIINGKSVPYHLIDIAGAGDKYNVFCFQRDFDVVYKDIMTRHIRPILCGGSGLYLEAAIGRKAYMEVKEDVLLRNELMNLSMAELGNILTNYKSLHNISDTADRERCIRAIEIAKYENENPRAEREALPSVIFGIDFTAEELRKRISFRLKERLNNGLIEEVEGLLYTNKEHTLVNINPETLFYYGLEYKYVTEHILGKYNKIYLYEKLFLAICQFAKRQRTWFRRMEKQGYIINWLDGSKTTEEKLAEVIKHI